MRQAWSWWLALVAPSVFTSSCKTIEGTYGVPPFYEVYDTPSSVGSTKGTETFFRPLGSFETLLDRGDTVRGSGSHLRILSPFADFRWGLAGKRFWVLPIFHYRSLPQPFGGEDVDWIFLPFLGGRDPEEGRYFACLPFGGKLRGLLGQDEIDFVLFPIYWHTRSDKRHSLHIVWPLGNTVWGGDWSGWRFWPFYGRYQSRTEDGELRYDRSFVLWPFYIHHRDQLHLLPTDLFFTFPFYGRHTNSRVDHLTILWPFFQSHHDRKYNRTTTLGYLFPYRFTEGQTDAWPIFGVKRTSHGTDIAGVKRRTFRHFTIWPFERYEWAADGLEESTRFWLLPLLWHFHYIDRDTLETEVEWTLWPLLRYRREPGAVELSLISPLWFRREDYDRLYSRIFNVFRYRWKPQISGWEILYGALMYRSDRDIDEKVFSVLGGLLEVGTRGGSVAFRLLYVPWW